MKKRSIQKIKNVTQHGDTLIVAEYIERCMRNGEDIDHIRLRFQLADELELFLESYENEILNINQGWSYATDNYYDHYEYAESERHSANSFFTYF